MRRALALVGCMLLGSCGNQPTAGGGSDQPNSLELAILRADGTTPAVGAAARWVSGSWNSTDTASRLDSVVLGAQAVVGGDGRLRIERPGPGRWHLEVIDSSARQVAIVNTIGGAVVRLTPAARWSGVLASRGALPASLGLVGTSRRASIGADRSFTLDWLPAGAYRILGSWSVEHRELAYRRLETGEVVANDTLDGDSAETDLVNLERTPLRCALRGRFWPDPDTAKGKWFLTLDSTSRILPATFFADPLQALRTDEARRYLRWTFRIGAAPYFYNGLYQYPWAGVGLSVAPDGNGLDWRGVTTIRVLARGTGAFRLQLNTRKVSDLASWEHFGYWMALDADWRWFEIPVAALRPGEMITSKGVAWTDAASGVHSIQFLASGADPRLELADIRVRGSIGPKVP